MFNCNSTAPLLGSSYACNYNMIYNKIRFLQLDSYINILPYWKHPHSEKTRSTQKDDLKEFARGLGAVPWCDSLPLLRRMQNSFWMSLKAQWVLDEQACADTPRCFPLAVQQVSSDSAPSSGINLSFLKRISSSLVTQVLRPNWVATEGG